MTKKYFGTDGIRGTVGENNITPDFMLKLGWAAGKVFGVNSNSKVLIGKDTRISGYMFESALEAGLVAAGVDAQLMGPMPTPGVAYLTRTFRAQAGIVISASHNPYQDNGIKFFSGQGDKLDDSVEAAIEDYLDKPMTTVGSADLGKAARIDDAAGRYIEFCKSTIPSVVDFSNLKIVLDCANGATYHIAPHVFKELGANIITIGNEPDGLNINHNVGSTEPEALMKAVVNYGADLGIAFDGDGDRVAMVDKNGRLIDGDQLIYIIAMSRLRSQQLVGDVVGTKMTNLGVEHALARQDIGLVRTDVGDRYIMEKLKAENWIIGGESSGHIICRDRTTTGDGIVAALQVLAEMHFSRKTLEQLLDDVVLYPQQLINIRLGKSIDVINHPDMMAAVEKSEQALANNGRVLLRPSGTEPLIRVMVEGKNAQDVKHHAESLAQQVKDIIALA